MGIIGVDCAGLALLAAGCEQHAAAVAGSGETPLVTEGLSATSAAVHIDVDAAAQRIATRLQSTGQKASFEATRFAATELHNDYLLDAIAQSATVEV